MDSRLAVCSKARGDYHLELRLATNSLTVFWTLSLWLRSKAEIKDNINVCACIYLYINIYTLYIYIYRCIYSYLYTVLVIQYHLCSACSDSLVVWTPGLGSCPSFACWATSLKGRLQEIESKMTRCLVAASIDWKEWGVSARQLEFFVNTKGFNIIHLTFSFITFFSFFPLQNRGGSGCILRYVEIKILSWRCGNPVHLYVSVLCLASLVQSLFFLMIFCVV